MRPVLCVLITTTFLAAGCGGADESPLGGPFGSPTVRSAGPGVGSGAASGAASAGPDAGSGAGTGGGSDSGGAIVGSGIDSGSDAPAGPVTGGAPTWTQIYADYLTGSSTLGHCGQSGCHGQMGGTPTAAWSWLSSQGYAGQNLLGAYSCLQWFGGNMPRGYTGAGTAQETKAISDMNAWGAAGALQN